MTSGNNDLIDFLTYQWIFEDDSEAAAAAAAELPPMGSGERETSGAENPHF